MSKISAQEAQIIAGSSFPEATNRRLGNRSGG
jgi:hypothetical protein